MIIYVKSFKNKKLIKCTFIFILIIFTNFLLVLNLDNTKFLIYSSIILELIFLFIMKKYILTNILTNLAETNVSNLSNFYF